MANEEKPEPKVIKGTLPPEIARKLQDQLQAQVQGSQLLHDHGFCLDDIEQLNRKIGGGKIRLCQGISTHRLDDTRPEGQVHKRPALGTRRSDAPKSPLCPA